MAEAYFSKPQSKDPFERSKKCEPLTKPEDVIIIAGTSNPELGASIAKYLNKPLANSKV